MPRGCRSSRWVRPWPALLVSIACAGEPRAEPSVAEGKPHPPGIAVDLETELPKPAPSADPGSGLVVLTEPVDTAVARQIVASYFEAIVSESESALEHLLVPGARIRTNGRAHPELALPVWHRRFERLDYKSLGTDALYHPGAIETYTVDSSASLRDRSLPLSPRGGEILVRIPMAGGRISGFFGPEIALLLRSGPDGYVIADVVEDFRY